MKRVVLVAITTVLSVVGLVAFQTRTPPPAPATAKPAAATAANPITDSTRAGYEAFKGWLGKSAEQMKEADYGFKPVGVAAEVRTFGQIIGHVADANVMFCSIASGMPGPATVKDVEKTKKTKADLQKALADAFAFCDKAWAATTDTNAATPVELPEGLGKNTRLGALAFNSAHNGEHYGNIVTYMRAKGLVPPSSQPAK
jgi:uncharacterized damage-inducible protein DinB